MFGKKLLATSALVATAAAVGAVATRDVNSRWYRKLDKPDLQPPRQAFPIVWSTLYASIALASAGVLASQRKPKGYRRALALNLGLNAGWSWTFFRQHDLDLALTTASALAVSSTDLARRSGKAHRGLGWALAPYALWCWFATLLTSRIRSLND